MELPDFLILDGQELRRSGATWLARCPFHEERSPSFTVWNDHAHCYGCGWHGGIFKYVMDRWNCDFEAAKVILKDRGFICSSMDRWNCDFEAAKVILKDRGFICSSVPRRNYVPTPAEKPELPELCPLNEDGIHALAKLRCLSPRGIRLARDAGVLFGARWPQRRDSHQSWCVTDSSRNVAQFRRFDGKPYQMRDREIKAWTKGSPSWPVGCAALAEGRSKKDELRKIIIVEGGPDLLAAYHFLSCVFKVGRRQVAPEFTPVAMLGAGSKISAEALLLFNGKRVRIMRHDDDAGVRAAENWSDQLVTAGASVATCCFSRLHDQRRVMDALLDFNF